MVDPLVGATAQVLFEKILSLAMENIGLRFGFKKDVQKLRASVAMIQAVLADAEKKQHQQEAVKLWLKRLEGVAYEADDLLDELNYELLRRRVKTTQYPLKDKVCFFFSPCNTVIFRWRMARKIGNINFKLKAINEEANRFGLQSQLVACGSNTIIRPASAESKICRETDSVIDQNVVGRANETSKIVEKLLSPSTEVVSFITITGMGGLGKTTLAQLVYNDAQIDNYFDRKIWVCVSDNFDVTRVFKLILESLKRRNMELMSRDAIVQEIKEELQGKRYLLVLDDVWCENSAMWDDFCRSLVGISTVEGNWSLLTTRLLEVASAVTASPPFPLEKLSDDDCWIILKRKAFPSGEVPEELNAIKEKIIRACQGVPLVASLVGGFLRINAKEMWLSILGDDILKMTGSDSVMQILKLSFDHLPSASIKKCFAYCSLFRKDTDMEKHMLIQLWMAEGFLQLNDGNEMEMEAIGLRYFDILVKSSLFQEVTNESGVICGRMHDFVHDLAQYISKSEIINLQQGVRNDNCRGRYLVLEFFQEDEHPMLEERSSSLRTMFIECHLFTDLVYLHFKCLRVLKLSIGVKHNEFANSISNLIYLRYLDLSASSAIKSLPESLCKLYNLQTLRLCKLYRLIKLPEGMSNLISLRHFHCDYWKHDIQMPLRMGRLTCLQTLELFNIGPEKGRQIEEIGSLTNLRGTLKLRNLELVNGKKGARLANLSRKPKLVDLRFEWARGREGEKDDVSVLEGLEPHPNLKKLVVENFMGSQFPWWIMKMACLDQRTNLLNGMNNLVELKLINCKRCEEVPSLGQLPLLKSLQLMGLLNVRCIGSAFYGGDNGSRSGQLSKQSFPALKTLELRSLSNLVDWMGLETTLATGETVEVFPNLEELTIWDCPQLTTAPHHFPSLKRLKMGYAGANNESLLLSICDRVTTLSTLDIRGKGLNSFPDAILGNNKNLRSLWLNNCDDLVHVTRYSFSTCKKFRDLSIERCPLLKSVFFHSEQQLPSSLRSLRIQYCNELINLPGELIQSCKSLKKLWVSDCPNLVSFPVDLQHTTSVSTLGLSNCPKLIPMPKGFGSCSNLRELVIGPFSDSVELNWSDLSSSSVRKLTMHGWPHSVSLPDQLQCLTKITELSLRDFGCIESLPDWLENLASLELLDLFLCKKLMYLPSMEAMKRLTNLRTLWIHYCPMLEEGCSPSNSEWSKISHIPNIWIT